MNKIIERSEEFNREFTNAEAYLEKGEDYFRDITDDVGQQIHNSLTESFEQMNENSFPVETEREIVFEKNGENNGLKLYVQKDKNNIYCDNERRILVAIDQERSISAIVYNLVVIPEELQDKYNVDGCLGITYSMTNQAHQGCGFASAMIDKAHQKCIDFLKERLQKFEPKIMIMTEQNDPMSMTVKDAIKDWEGTGVSLTQRLAFWGKKCGQRKIKDFKYKQVSLRKGLPSMELGLFVKMPNDQEIISSELLQYCVKSYAHLALNKQELDNIDEDQDMKEMIKQLNLVTEFHLEPPVTEYKEQDNKIKTAIKQLLLGNLVEKENIEQFMNNTVTELLNIYEIKVKQ